MSPSASQGNSSAARVSFLYSGPGSDTNPRNPGIKPKPRPKPFVLPPVPTSPVVSSSKPRQPHTSWVHSAKQKEEAGAQSRAKESGRTSQRTSFLSAVSSGPQSCMDTHPRCIPAPPGETPADMKSHLDKDGGEASTLTAEEASVLQHRRTWCHRPDLDLQFL